MLGPRIPRWFLLLVILATRPSNRFPGTSTPFPLPMWLLGRDHPVRSCPPGARPNRKCPPGSPSTLLESRRTHAQVSFNSFGCSHHFYPHRPPLSISPPCQASRTSHRPG